MKTLHMVFSSPVHSTKKVQKTKPQTSKTQTTQKFKTSASWGFLNDDAGWRSQLKYELTSPGPFQHYLLALKQIRFNPDTRTDLFSLDLLIFPE